MQYLLRGDYLQKIDKQIPWIYDLVGIAFLTKSALKRVLMSGRILNIVDIQELIPISSGAFITYWAVNGSGYVRIIKPEMKKEVKQLGAIAGDPEEKFDYVEHLLLGLKSVTYYGRTK